MSAGKRVPWLIILGLALGLILVVVGVFVLDQAQKSSVNLPVLGQIPSFQFTDNYGRPFGDRQMQGKVCVVDFIFTRCVGVCPVMAESMSELYRAFRGVNDVQFVSISVDPAFDTPEVLDQYGRRQGVTDDRWVFLNGPIEEVVRVCESGFLLPAEDLPMGHSAKFVLVDRRGRIRGYFDSDEDMAPLKAKIAALLKSKS
jgi:protein SCO1/2